MTVLGLWNYYFLFDYNKIENNKNSRANIPVFSDMYLLLFRKLQGFSLITLWIHKLSQISFKLIIGIRFLVEILLTYRKRKITCQNNWIYIFGDTQNLNSLTGTDQSWIAWENKTKYLYDYDEVDILYTYYLLYRNLDYTEVLSKKQFLREHISFSSTSLITILYSKQNDECIDFTTMCVYVPISLFDFDRKVCSIIHQHPDEFWSSFWFIHCIRYVFMKFIVLQCTSILMKNLSMDRNI